MLLKRLNYALDSFPPGKQDFKVGGVLLLSHLSTAPDEFIYIHDRDRWEDLLGCN